MTRISPDKSGLSADPPTDKRDDELLAHRLLDQSPILEVFDDAIRLRFGRFISAATRQFRKRR